MKKADLLLCVLVLCLLIGVPSLASGIAAPGDFKDIMNYDTVYVEQDADYYQISWEPSPDADRYQVSAKLLTYSPDLEDNEDETGISLLDHESTKKTKIKIPLDELEDEGWIKIAVGAVNDEKGESGWNIIYLYIMREAEPPEIDIRNPKDGSAYTVGDDVRIRITGENYDHFYYEIYRDDVFVENQTLDSDLDEYFYVDQPGTYSIYAVATNSSEHNTTDGQHYTGDRAEDRTVFYVESQSLPAPEIQISSPYNGQVFNIGDTLYIDISGSNYDHYYYEVRCGSEKINWSTEYSDISGVTVSLNQSGDYEVYVVATNSPEVNTTVGQAYTGERVEQTVYFNVQEVQLPAPEIRINSPYNGQAFNQGDTMYLDISGSNYDHYYYEVRSPSEVISRSTEYNDISGMAVSLNQSGDYEVYVVATNSPEVNTTVGQAYTGERVEQTVYFNVQEVQLPAPEIRINSPYNGQAFNQGDTMYLEISGSNYDHYYYEVRSPSEVISRSTEYNDISGVAVSLNQPGDYEVYVVATNSPEVNTTVGQAYTGDRVEQTVNFAVQEVQVAAPEIQINTPYDGQVFNLGDTLFLDISGRNYDHYYYEVRNANEVIDRSTEYNDSSGVSFPLDRPGDYEVYVVVTNSPEVNTTVGQAYTGDRVEKTVYFTVLDETEHALPEIRITSPYEGQTFTAGDVLLLDISGANYDHYYYEVRSVSEVIGRSTEYNDISGVSIPLDRPGDYEVYVVATNSTEVNTTVGQEYTGDRIEKKVSFTVLDVPVLPLPEIRINSPYEGQVFNAGDTLLLDISGANYDHYYYEVRSVSEVIGRSTEYNDISGVSIPLDRPGNYEVYVVATNSIEVNATAGQDYTGDRVEKTVRFTVLEVVIPTPEIHINKPYDGQLFNTGDEMTIDVTGTQYTSCIIEVLCDNKVVFTTEEYADSQNTYAFEAPGKYTVYVLATNDNSENGQKNTAEARVIVTATEKNIVLPGIRINSPFEGQSFVVDDTVVLNISGDNFDSISYRLSSDGSITEEGTENGNITKNVAARVPGTYTLYAEAVNADGVNSSELHFTVAERDKPAIGITPVNGITMYQVGDMAQLSISGANYTEYTYAVSMDGVQLSGGTERQNRRLDLTLNRAGTYIISARATNQQGDVAEAQITLTAAPQQTQNLPTISINSPANGAHFNAGAPVSLNISGSNYDHYYYDIKKDGVMVAHEICWTSIDKLFVFNEPGEYVIWAVATDSTKVNVEANVPYGGNRTEQTATIHVDAAEKKEVYAKFAAPKDNSEFAIGDIFTISVQGEGYSGGKLVATNLNGGLPMEFSFSGTEVTCEFGCQTAGTYKLQLYCNESQIELASIMFKVKGSETVLGFAGSIDPKGEYYVGQSLHLDFVCEGYTNPRITVMGPNYIPHNYNTAVDFTLTQKGKYTILLTAVDSAGNLVNGQRVEITAQNERPQYGIPSTQGTLKIGNVDLGFSAGDYFTKNGGPCSCHHQNLCEDDKAGCNCIRYWSDGNTQIDFLGTQCLSFARYCQWKYYGSFDAQNNGKFTRTGSVSTENCTAEYLKNRFLGCMPATHLRLGNSDTKKYHSISIVSTSETGLTYYQCNWSGDCQITKVDATWQELANLVVNRGGINCSYEALSDPNHEHDFSYHMVCAEQHPHQVTGYCSCGESKNFVVYTVDRDCCECVGHDWDTPSVYGGYVNTACLRCGYIRKKQTNGSLAQQSYIDLCSVLRKNSQSYIGMTGEDRVASRAWMAVSGHALDLLSDRGFVFGVGFVNSLNDMGGTLNGNNQFLVDDEDVKEAQKEKWKELIIEMLNHEDMDKVEQKVSTAIDHAGLALDVVGGGDDIFELMGNVKVADTTVQYLSDSVSNLRLQQEIFGKAAGDATNPNSWLNAADSALAQMRADELDIKLTDAEKTLKDAKYASNVAVAIPFIMEGISSIIEGSAAADELENMQDAYVKMTADYLGNRQALLAIISDAKAMGNKELQEAAQEILKEVDEEYVFRLSKFCATLKDITDGLEMFWEGASTTATKFAEGSVDVIAGLAGGGWMTAVKLGATVIEFASNNDEIAESGIKLMILSDMNAATDIFAATRNNSDTDYIYHLWAGLQKEGCKEAINYLNAFSESSWFKKDISDLGLTVTEREDAIEILQQDQDNLDAFADKLKD